MYSLSLSLSVHFNGHFSRYVSVSRYHNVSALYFVGAKGDGGGGENWSYKYGGTKLQSNHHHQPTNTQLFYRSDALPVAQPTVSKR